MDNEQWYTRPVMFVRDVAAAVKFYREVLGFEKAWDYHDKDSLLVAQINRGTKCEIILSLDPARAGLSRLFIELLPAELSAFNSEIENRKIQVENTYWGMPVVAVRDPDGNELFFPTGE